MKNFKKIFLALALALPLFAHADPERTISADIIKNNTPGQPLSIQNDGVELERFDANGQVVFTAPGGIEYSGNFTNITGDYTQFLLNASYNEVSGIFRGYFTNNIFDDVMGGYNAIAIADLFQGATVGPGAILSITNDYQTGTVLDGHTAVTINNTYQADVLDTKDTTQVNVGSQYQTKLNNYQGITHSPSFSGIQTGGWSGYSDTSQFAATYSQPNVLKFINLSPGFTSGASLQSVNMIFNGLTLQSGVTVNDVTMYQQSPQLDADMTSFQGINFNSQGAGDIGLYKEIGISGNMSGDIDDYRGVSITPNFPAEVQNSAVLLEIDASNVNTASGQPAQAIDSKGGTHTFQLETTLSGSLPFFNFNQLGGQINVADGSPITDAFGFVNNLGTNLLFNDDIGPSADPGNLGISNTAIVGAVAGATGKTADAFNFLLLGASNPNGAGHINYVSMIRSGGISPAGGSLTIGEMFGLRLQDGLCALSATCHGLYVEDEDSESWVAGSTTIGGSTYSAPGAELDVNGDARIRSLAPGGVVHADADGDLSASQVNLATEVTGVLPEANGGTGESTYTDGQLLIGNTGTTGLNKATLTAGTNISITNGPGSITINATGGGGGSAAEWAGYFASSMSLTYWTFSSTSYTDGVLVGTKSLVEQYNDGMGTVSAASSDWPGITLTAPETGTLKLCFRPALQAPSAQSFDLRLIETDASTIIATTSQYGTGVVAQSVAQSICGYFPVTASTAYEFVLQGKSTSGSLAAIGGFAMETILWMDINYVK